MSFLTTVEKDLSAVENAGVKVGEFLKRAVTDAVTLDNAYLKLSAPTKAVMAAVLNDALKVVASGAAVAADAQTGNIPGAVAAASSTTTLVGQLYEAFKNGTATIVDDFKALNIKL